MEGKRRKCTTKEIELDRAQRKAKLIYAGWLNSINNGEIKTEPSTRMSLDVVARSLWTKNETRIKNGELHKDNLLYHFVLGAFMQDFKIKYQITKFPNFFIYSVFAVFCATSSASAEPPKFFSSVEAFQTPSKNIFCIYFPDTIRCDIGVFTPTTFGPFPENNDKSYVEIFGRCDPKRAVAFSLGTDNVKASNACPSDTAMNMGPVLNYGTQWSANGLTCMVETKGVTCTNKFNHGFFLSRNKQELF